MTNETRNLFTHSVKPSTNVTGQLHPHIKILTRLERKRSRFRNQQRTNSPKFTAQVPRFDTEDGYTSLGRTNNRASSYCAGYNGRLSKSAKTAMFSAVACMLFVFLWSSGWVGSKYGQEYAGTFTLLAYRYVLVVFVLLIFVSIKRSWRYISRQELFLHCLVGVLSHAVYCGAANSAFGLGVSAGMVAFITALTPMITATFASGMTGEVTNLRQWCGLALGLFSVVLVVADKIATGGAALAYSLPFVAIMALSLASLLDRQVTLKNKQTRSQPTPLSLVCLIHCSSTLAVVLPIAIFTEGLQVSGGSEFLFSVLWLAFLVSLGAYGLMFFLLRRMTAVKVASLEYFAPPITMVLAYLMFGEQLSRMDFIGLILAAIAVWLVVSIKPSRLRKTARGYSQPAQAGAT